MSAVTRTQLLPGVFLTSVHTKKFKSSVLSMTLLAPLAEGDAAANALIPYLLRRGANAIPTFKPSPPPWTSSMEAPSSPWSAKRARHSA